MKKKYVINRQDYFLTEKEVLNKLESKIDIMEVKVNDAARTINTIHKLFWVVVAGSVTYFLPSLLKSFPV